VININYVFHINGKSIITPISPSVMSEWSDLHEFDRRTSSYRFSYPPVEFE
jgi:hypothetical protein